MRKGTLARLSASIFALSLGIAAKSSAAFIEFQTPETPGHSTAGGQNVDATAQFTTSNGQIVVVLSNLQANPTSVAQNISGIIFTINTGQDSGTLASSSGIERIVEDNGKFSDANCQTSTGWSLSTVGSQFELNVLNTNTGPAHTIIGPDDSSTGFYDAANGSIANGGGPHDPFLGLSATFTLGAVGVTSASTISAATFCFGTSSGSIISGATAAQLPEPAGAALLMIGGIPMLARRKRQKTI